MLDIEALRAKAERGELTSDEQHRISIAYTNAQFQQQSYARRLRLSKAVEKQLQLAIKKQRAEFVFYDDDIDALKRYIAEFEAQKQDLRQRFTEAKNSRLTAKAILATARAPRLRYGTGNDVEYFQGYISYFTECREQLSEDVERLAERIAELGKFIDQNREKHITARLDRCIAQRTELSDAARRSRLYSEYEQFQKSLATSNSNIHHYAGGVAAYAE